MKHVVTVRHPQTDEVFGYAVFDTDDSDFVSPVVDTEDEARDFLQEIKEAA